MAHTAVLIADQGDPRPPSAARPVLFLSHADASARLLRAAEAALAEHRPVLSATPSFFRRPDTIAVVVAAIGLIGFYVLEAASPSPFQFRATGALVEGLLLIAAAACNAWLQTRETRLTRCEMSARIHSTIEIVRKYGIAADALDFRFPCTIPSVSVTRVVRDGTVRLLPSNLLVVDDLILLAYGDAAPCKVRFLGSKNSPPSANASATETNSGSATKPSITINTGAPASSSNSDHVFLETGQIFRPDIFSANGIDPQQAQQSLGIATNGTAFYFTVAEFPIRSVITAALNQRRPETVMAHQLALIEHLLINRTLWAVLVISFVINILRFFLLNLSSISENAHTAYEMFINLQVYAILPIVPLSYPTLTLIARSYGNAQILGLFEALQTSKTAFEDKDDVDEFDAAPAPTKDIAVSWSAIWRKFVDQLTNVDISFLARTTGLIESLASTTVVCAIDREGTIAAPLPSIDKIFLVSESGDPVVLDVSEDRSLPNGVRFEDKDWIQHLPLLKPFGLAQFLRTECGVHLGRRRNDTHLSSHQIHVHGNVAPARQTCLCTVGREIGFTKEIANQFVAKATIESFAPHHSSVRDDAYDYHFEIPSMISRIFFDASSGSYQLFSDGSLDVVLDSCGDFWTGRGLGQITDSVERKIYEFYQNAVLSDMQVVAYAYRPIHNPASFLVRGAVPSTPVYLEMPADAPMPVTPALTPQPDGLSASTPASLGMSPLNNSANPSESNDASSSQPVLSSSLMHPLTPMETSSPLLVPQSQQLLTQHVQTSSSGQSTSQQHGSSRARKRTTRARATSKIDTDLTMDTQEFYEEAVKGQTFLAMASFGYAPKPNVVDIIEDFALSGIRFVYFSPAPERESKAYAERLGLEIDWNSCIILSPEGVGPGYLALHDMKAKLPKGVENVRSHIAHVDDVPLHVSLFAESEPHSIREMVRIFQEHGEVVCCIGSSLNNLNVECFALADISIAVDALPGTRHGRHGPHIGPLSPLSVAAGFTSSPCALSLNTDVSLYSITQIVREARTLAANASQAYMFYVGCQTALVATLLLSFCVLTPPLLAGYQMLFLAWIVLPLISASFLFTPHLPDVMTHMPVKNADHMRDLRRFVWYCIARFCIVPPVICVLIFISTITKIVDPVSATTTIDAPSSPYFHFNKDYLGASWTKLNTSSQSALLFSQNVAMYAYVVMVVVISSTCLTRTESVVSRPPYTNTMWIVSIILALLIQTAFFAISNIGSPFQPTHHVPWYAWIILSIGIIVVVPVQEMVKMHDKREWVRFQKRSKLEFNTKLGMHSPI